jgi:ankyrin repeat protein
VKDGFGDSALAKASEGGYEGIVRSLLLHDDRSLDNLSNNQGNAGLLLSAENGYTRILHLLNRQNANPNRQNNDGDTALIRVAMTGNSDIVNILLQHIDTDVTVKNKKGQTALPEAARRGYTETVRILLKRSEIDINVQTEDGYTL